MWSLGSRLSRLGLGSRFSVALAREARRESGEVASPSEKPKLQTTNLYETRDKLVARRRVWFGGCWFLVQARLLTTINKQESVMVDTRIFTIYQVVILEYWRQLITS